MKALSRHHGKLTIVKRLKNSLVGNPRFEVIVDGYRCKTAPNSSLAYRLSNYDGRKVVATIGTLRGVQTLNEVEQVIE